MPKKRKVKRKIKRIQHGNGIFEDIGNGIKSGAKYLDKAFRENKVISNLANIVDFVPGLNIPGTNIGVSGLLRASTKLSGYGKVKRIPNKRIYPRIHKTGQVGI